jgi:glycosyltransferase involved in cell wall biosynthesis
MLSVIIATRDSERALVRTLAALVPGATAGLISEVIVTDAGSRDDTASVADITGCTFLMDEGALGSRLKAAAATARAPWLLFLRPGIVLEPAWIGEARHFVEHTSPNERAAVFRPGARGRSALIEAWSLMKTALGAKPRAEQGLLIGKPLYDMLGGHRDTASPESDLLRRIGRRRIVMLACTAADVGV